MKLAKFALWCVVLIIGAVIITAVEMSKGQKFPYFEGAVCLICIFLSKFLCSKLEYWKINRDYKKQKQQTQGNNNADSPTKKRKETP